MTGSFEIDHGRSYLNSRFGEYLLRLGETCSLFFIRLCTYFFPLISRTGTAMAANYREHKTPNYAFSSSTFVSEDGGLLGCSLSLA